MSGGRHGGGGPLLFWACLQLVLGAGLFVWTGGTPAFLFLAGATVLMAAAGWNRARPPGDRPRLLPAVSLPVVLVAAGVAGIAIGFTAGLWLALVGGEILVFGAVWLAREMRDERRALAGGEAADARPASDDEAAPADARPALGGEGVATDARLASGGKGVAP